nr:hydroxymethylbilane synthase [Paludisphaera mucosa]
MGLKHERGAYLAPALAALWAEARRDALAAAPADALVVPVPLHWLRRLGRRYNQAEVLARALAEATGREPRAALRRVRRTPHLVGRGRQARALAMRGAFAARPGADVKGRTILLVDDVLTTGATLGSAARALKRAGARRVVAVVVSRELRGGAPMTAPPTTTPELIRIGTRGSRLARWQAEWVADALRARRPGLTVELVEIKTHGDRDRNSPLSAIGGAGLFTKEIQRAVLDGTVDVAVHSLKDLPTQGPEELVLGAVPAREDVADALIAPTHRTLEALPPGAHVGTGSLRRRAQILHARPDLIVSAVRGNVETRLNLALDGKLDAVILAWAGLHRLGLHDRVTQRLEPPAVLPAVGQGALGIECRADDAATRRLLALLDDPEAHRAVVAERRALAELEGGCMIPMAAWGRTSPDGARLLLDAAVFDPDGRTRVAASLEAPLDAADDLGRRVAQALREQGAEAILEAFRAGR